MIKTLAKLHSEDVKTLYMIKCNIGGFLHRKVYTLKYKPKYTGYWNKQGNEGFSLEDKIRIGFNKDSAWCWHFITESKGEAELVLSGAAAMSDFLKEQL